MNADQRRFKKADGPAVAEANQVVFFNQGEEYSVSHPVDGGDASLSIEIAAPLLQELAASKCLG